MKKKVEIAIIDSPRPTPEREYEALWRYADNKVRTVVEKYNLGVGACDIYDALINDYEKRRRDNINLRVALGDIKHALNTLEHSE